MQIRARALFVGAMLFCLDPAASAITIDWVPIANPGNAADTTGYGAVGYNYSIDKYEVTNAQYAEFLNAKAASDPLALYNGTVAFQGISRSGVSGSYTYAAVVSREDQPVHYVSFYDAVRFANWLNNGQGNGDTETGAYTLLGGTATPSNGMTVTRNPGATIFLTSENEWYKAAYYNAITTSYFDYPAGSDTATTCSAPTVTANRANCNNAVGDMTNKGSYTGSASPYGTFDQGGNVTEWNEAIVNRDDIAPGFKTRGYRGGGFGSPGFTLAASTRLDDFAESEYSSVGFRIATIGLVPEPSTGLLVMIGLLGLARWRRSN